MTLVLAGLAATVVAGFVVAEAVYRGAGRDE